MNYTKSQHARITISDQELFDKTFAIAKTEQTAALELLNFLVEIDLRKLYTVKAYSSLFEYIVKELGFSESQAYERVNVARLMRSMNTPKNIISEKIEQGQLTLTTASQVQRFFNQEKKIGDGPISENKKLEILESASGKSKREVEKLLITHQSENTKVIAQEKTRMVSENLTELKFQIKEETAQKLNEVKDLIGNESLARIFDEGLTELLHKLKKKQGRTEKVSKINVPPQAIAIVHNDKTQIQAKPQPQVVPAKADSAKPTLPAKSKTQTSTNTTLDARTVNAIPKRSRFISIHAKRTVFARSKGQCEFISSDVTRCKSRHRLHLDHIQPFAKNGSNEAENLRHLCAQHNQRAAIEQGLQQTSTRTGADFVKFMQNSPLAESSLEI